MINENEIVIQDDIIGRLRNTPLQFKHALLPLFESIINSIQSIEDSQNSNAGEIYIFITRDGQEDCVRKVENDKSRNPVESYLIRDNGVGFNQDNFLSFTTADSRLKERKGGKGVGRFVWLKAFDLVKIESIYCESNQYHKRNFLFKAASPAIENHSLNLVKNCTAYTEVELCGLKNKYQQKTPYDPKLIAQKIIDHCIIYLLSPSCPKIVLIDEEHEEFININDEFKNEVAVGNSKLTVKVIDKSFEIDLMYLNSSYDGDHRISLCADDREVKSYNLKKYIPDLAGRKIDTERYKNCTLVAIVKSEYLDKSVNTERTDFLFSSIDDDDIGDVFDISERSILETISAEIMLHIDDFLEKIKLKKLERIREFVENEEPEYRVLLKHAPEELSNIPVGIDDFRLDTELHKILHNVELQTKEEGREFINADVETVFESPEYREKFDNYVDKLLDLKQSELSKYVIHRKTIIDLLGRLLNQREDGKYSLEEEVHKLIYPMKKSSDEIDFGHQNLWLLDEKLTYHYFLASDKPFSKMQKLSIESQDRPDLLVMNKPASFVEGEYPYQSVVIIELKRPQRTNYPASEKDPFDQVYGYIEELKGGKVIGSDGVHVELGKEARFYCYIVADLTSSIKQKAIRHGFRNTIDGDGYYYFNENYNAYLEVIGYRKLYEDAKKRNKVLFDKLGLPVR